MASYLVLDLGVDWRRGADYFENVLLDYDVRNYVNAFIFRVLPVSYSHHCLHLAIDVNSYLNYTG